MMPESTIEALEALAREACDRSGDPSHDFSHVLRVVTQARRMGEELGADLSVLIPAALLHDVVQVPKNHPDRALASAQAAKAARGLLTERFGIDPERADRIATVILEHSYSAGKQPSSLESAILQDADRLDAIGAIGVVRAFSCGTRMGSAFYDLNEPFANGRELDDRHYALDHFYVKLLKLVDRFNTEPGRREAAQRAVFLRAFLEQFAREIETRKA